MRGQGPAAPDVKIAAHTPHASGRLLVDICEAFLVGNGASSVSALALCGPVS